MPQLTAMFVSFYRCFEIPAPKIDKHSGFLFPITLSLRYQLRQPPMFDILYYFLLDWPIIRVLALVTQHKLLRD